MKTVLVLLCGALILTACNNNTPTMKTEVKTGPAPARTAKAPDEKAALDALRKINAAQATYFKINRRYALTFDELVEARLLNAEPSAAATGYDFKLRPSADAQTFKVSVTPAGTPETGIKYFFMDQTGVIRVESGKEATAESPPVN